MTFPLPVLKTELHEDDYVKLGLLSGIEIHQQLEGEKLFCTCPTTIRDDTADFIVTRFLRASAGESGKVDAAALAETKKLKYYRYEGYTDSTCLVELDEEPPGPVNKKALYASLQIAKLFFLHPVDQLRFMRKTVVNGSNTSGFQRTGLIGINGKIEAGSLQTTKEPIRIDAICLEEDACKDVEKTSEFTTYNLSRLGIPLIEIATGPDMKTPEQIAEVAEYIGMVLRSLDNVKRGLGTIRQDVNISIKDGLRVEIKGAQDLRMIPTIAQYEALRQYNLLQIFVTLQQRMATVGEEIIDVTKLFEKSTSKVITSGLSEEDGVVLALPLYKFAGLVGLETQPGRRYGSELSDYAKVMGVKGLFHSDELPAYGITQGEKDSVYDFLKLNKDEDAYLLIAASKEIALRAMNAARQRASDFNLRKEVRTALPDGNSKYMRPMPGAARMYPETDVQPTVLDLSNVEIPVLLSKRIADYVKEFGIAKDLAKRLLKDGIDLKQLTTRYSNLKPAFIIDFFYGLSGVIKKKHGLDVKMDCYSEVLLKRLNDGKLSKDALEEIVVLLAKGNTIDYTLYEPMSLDDIKDDVKKIVEEMKDAPRGAIIGKVMGVYKGKVDGKELSDYVYSLLK